MKKQILETPDVIINPYSFAGDTPANKVTSANLKLWLEGEQAFCLDASDIACDDGDLCKTWVDRSGNAQDAVQATVADQPVFHIADTHPEWSEEGYMSFESNRWTHGPDLSSMTAGELFMLCRTATNVTTGGHEFGTTTSTQDRWPFGGSLYSTFGLGASHGAADRLQGSRGSIDLTTRHIRNEWCVDGDRALYIGTTLIDSNSGSFTPDFNADCRIGSTENGTKWNGSIRCLLVYDGKLSTSDREWVRDTYLAGL